MLHVPATVHPASDSSEQVTLLLGCTEWTVVELSNITQSFTRQKVVALQFPSLCDSVQT